MVKISYVLGMLAAGGAMGGTASAAVLGGFTTVTVNLPITSDANTTPITLAGATDPQYEYGSFANIPTVSGSALDDSGLISNLANLSGPDAIRSARIAAISGATSTKQDFGFVVGESFGSQPLTFQQFEANEGAYKQSYGFPVAGVVNGPDADSPGGNEYFYLLFTDAPESDLTAKNVFYGWATVGTPGANSTPGFVHPDSTSPSTLSTITYGAVPEPGSWAMLLAGVGLVGGAMRQSRRRRATLAA